MFTPQTSFHKLLTPTSHLVCTGRYLAAYSLLEPAQSTMGHVIILESDQFPVQNLFPRPSPYAMPRMVGEVLANLSL